MNLSIRSLAGVVSVFALALVSLGCPDDESNGEQAGTDAADISEEDVTEPDSDLADDDVDRTDAEEPDGGPLLPNQVRIVRDQWGVPHVTATSDRAAGYGYGWAQAEDQMVHILTSLWTALGRRTEIEGLELLEVDRSMRLLRLSSDIEAAWDSYPQAVREYLEGFAEGFNAYLQAHPEDVPDWAEPIEPAWPLALARLFLIVAQIDRANRERGGIGEGMVSLAFVGGEFDKLGSNGWAVNPQRTEEGIGLMTGDPHMPFFYEWRLFEGHIRAPSFEVAGAGFTGVPIPFFGRNRRVAWTWTWNLVDHADVYRLQLDPEDSERYRFDEESLPFETQEAQFHLPDGEFVTETLRWSVHGPVVHIDAEAGFALAYWMSGFGRSDTPLQFMEMLQAQDLDDFNTAMSRLEFVTYNLVAADVEGSIEYVWNARIPRRSEGIDAGRTLDGTTSDTLWDASDPIPFDELPQVRDPAVGFVQNCNNSWWKTTETEDDPPRDALPAGTSRDDEDSARAWRVRQALKEDASLTESEALALATEGDIIPAGPMLPLIVEAWSRWGSEHAEAEIIEPVVDLLADWDGTPDIWSAAPTIFTVWAYEMFHQTTFPPEALEWTIDDLTADLGGQILDAIASAVHTVVDLGGTWAVPWGLIHVVELGSARIPVRTGQHPAISLMNCNIDPFSQEDLYCQLGSAYTFFNVMEEPIRTVSVMPFSNTDNHERPYFDAVTRLFAERTLKPLPFTDEEIERYRESEIVLELPTE